MNRIATGVLVMGLSVLSATGLAAEGSSPAAEGSSHAAEGSSNVAEGSSNVAEGSLRAAEGSSHTAEGSPYAGEEMREIKALSATDIAGFLGGKGMGYAKAAELNGYPGPAHVLELAEELSLTADQRAETQAIFERMEAAAKDLGADMVAAERALDDAFHNKEITESSLPRLVEQIGDIDSRLRTVHLRAHLQQTEILDEHQIMRYMTLRGYQNGGHGGGHGGHEMHRDRHHRHHDE